jgi:spore coat protein U-like protein
MNRRLSLFVASVAALALIAFVRPARAGTATANLTVTANVLGACTIDAAALAFGNYDPAADRDMSTDITVHCTQGSSYWIGLGDGGNFSGGRRMAGGVAEFLSYGLYRSAADRDADIVWDNNDPGVANHLTASTAAAGFSDYTVTVFGRIPAGQNVSTGGYSDTVLMTVNF